MFVGTESGTVAARTGRQEKGDLLLDRCRVPVSPDEDSPGTGHTTTQMYPHDLKMYIFSD